MTKIGWTEKVAKEWRKYKPPSRPSTSEVRIYEYYMKKLQKMARDMRIMKNIQYSYLETK